MTLTTQTSGRKQDELRTELLRDASRGGEMHSRRKEERNSKTRYKKEDTNSQRGDAGDGEGDAKWSPKVGQRSPSQQICSYAARRVTQTTLMRRRLSEVIEWHQYLGKDNRWGPMHYSNIKAQ